MSDPTQSHISLTIPAEPEFIAVARLACAGIAHRLDLDLETADDLKLVVTEACGHLLTLSTGAPSLQVKWEFTEEQLCVTVQCCSGGAPLPTLGGNGSQWGEIGLFLIHSLMDEVTELQSPPGLRMVKYVMEPDDADE